MRTSINNRSVVFLVQDGCLVRIVAGEAGDDRTYTHRCEKAAFETVAHALAETPKDGNGTSQPKVARQEKLPYTQVNVALEFLKERGLVDVRHRRCYPATSGDLYLDAMVEYHALADGEAGKVG
jgi:hypothetical protein